MKNIISSFACLLFASPVFAKDIICEVDHQPISVERANGGTGPVLTVLSMTPLILVGMPGDGDLKSFFINIENKISVTGDIENAPLTYSDGQLTISCKY